MINTKLLKVKIFAAGLSQRQIASKMGRSPVYVNATINNKRDATLEDVDVLCNILDIEDPIEKCAIFLA